MAKYVASSQLVLVECYYLVIPPHEASNFTINIMVIVHCPFFRLKVGCNIFHPLGFFGEIIFGVITVFRQITT